MPSTTTGTTTLPTRLERGPRYDAVPVDSPPRLPSARRIKCRTPLHRQTARLRAIGTARNAALAHCRSPKPSDLLHAKNHRSPIAAVLSANTRRLEMPGCRLIRITGPRNMLIGRGAMQAEIYLRPTAINEPLDAAVEPHQHQNEFWRTPLSRQQPAPCHRRPVTGNVSVQAKYTPQQAIAAERAFRLRGSSAWLVHRSPRCRMPRNRRCAYQAPAHPAERSRTTNPNGIGMQLFVEGVPANPSAPVMNIGKCVPAR